MSTDSAGGPRWGWGGGGWRALLLAAVLPAAAAEPFVPAANLNLPVSAMREAPAPYAAFCDRNPGECDLSGPAVTALDAAQWALLRQVNRSVNQEIGFETDLQQYGEEEYWSYPRSGVGDCEDLALEKRARLVAAGLPRGALRMALAQHRRTLFSHAVLLVESDQGTWVLNGFDEAVVLWHRSPYNFEARERPDGRWERFDQSVWTYE